MFDASWLNVGSLVLGLTAWILPIVNLFNAKKQEQKKRAALSVVSMTACAISICLQLIYQQYLVKIEDWSAVMDTMGATTLVSGILLVGTILLNGIAFVLHTLALRKAAQ